MEKIVEKKFNIFKVVKADGSSAILNTEEKMTLGNALDFFGADAVTGIDNLLPELNDLCQGLKNLGLKVMRRERADKYVWVTDGTSVIYIEYTKYVGFTAAYEYVMGGCNGSGCRIINEDEPISPQLIYEMISDLSNNDAPKITKVHKSNKYVDGRKQKFYKDANEWKAKLWDNKTLFEI